METQVTVYMASKYAVDSGKLDGETVTFLSKSFGCARKVYNLYVDTYYHGLEQAGYQNGDDIPKVALPEVSSFKNQAGLSYLKEVDSLALANVKQQFEASVKRFREQDNHKAYTKRALRRSESGTEPLSFRGLKGMPKFHAKGHCRDSYTTNNQDGTVRLEGSLLKVPKLKQLLPLIMHRPLPEGAIIKNATISREGSGEIFVSIGFCYTTTMDLSIRAAAMDRNASFVENLRFLGLDYSQKELYVDSERNRAGYPHYYRKSEEKLARLQQKLSRMVKGSHNYEKQLDRIRKLHKKIANQRKDFLHKLSTRLVSRYDVIVVEDIDLRGMGQALHFGKNLHDNGFGMFREMLSYKLERKGSFLVKVDRKFASSQLCHVCHTKNHGVKDLDVRFWTCPACGHSFDRDRNAAINLVQEGRRIFLEYILLCMEREEAASRKAEALSMGRKKKKQPTTA